MCGDSRVWAGLHFEVGDLCSVGDSYEAGVVVSILVFSVFHTCHVPIAETIFFVLLHSRRKDDCGATNHHPFFSVSPVVGYPESVFQEAVPAGAELCGDDEMTKSIAASIDALTDGDASAAVFDRNVGELMLRPL